MTSVHFRSVALFCALAFSVLSVRSSYAASLYRYRKKHDSLLTEGGSKTTEEAVRNALDWLMRHQKPDGSWSCHDFTEACDKENGPCKNLAKNAAPWGKNDGRGWKEHDIGVTALAVLAFTGCGQSHRSGSNRKYVAVLKKAVDFLKKVQIHAQGDGKYDGCFRFTETLPQDTRKEQNVDEQLQWMYGHAIATAAAGELLLLSRDTLGLKKYVEDAAAFCLRAQNKGWGWRYSIGSPLSDSSITGWMFVALKTVETCRRMKLISRPDEAELKTSFAGALRWLDNATAANSGITGYIAPGDEGSMLLEFARLKDGCPYSHELSSMTGVSLFCRLLHGQNPSQNAIKRGAAVLMKHPPAWRPRSGRALSTINMYYWYYATLAMFQHGGRPWNEWNDALQATLLPTQRTAAGAKNGCAAGSWDPVGEWGYAGGRVYATAIGALTLEVYYRYARVHESGASRR